VSHFFNKESLSSLSIGKEMKDWIWRIVATILHLGNIEIGNGPNNFAYVYPRSYVSVSIVSKLLKVPSRDLLDLFLVRANVSSNKRVKHHNTTKEAIKLRDLLARHLYEILWKAIMEAINKTLRTNEEKNENSKIVSIVDVTARSHTGMDRLFGHLLLEKVYEHFRSTSLKGLLNDVLTQENGTFTNSEHILDGEATVRTIEVCICFSVILSHFL